MMLRFIDSAPIEDFENQITSIGNTVNDPTLFLRIKKDCLNKRSFLFMSKDGFIILKPMSGNQLLIWIAYSIRPVNRLAYLFEIEQFARDIGATRLVFWSKRKGFRRFAGKFGFTSMESEWMGCPITVWSKKLDYEA